MADQRTQKFCKRCKSNVLAVRPGTNHVLHLLLSLVTCLIWVPIWILSAIKIGGWKCPTCGSKC